jgi:hypothetical protein
VVHVELALAQAAELERGPVVAELELARVAELELARVAVPGLVRVAAVPVLGHPRAQLAVALRTKSVTAARRPDLVPHLAAEALAAAVAETTREPVAAEAAIVWEAVGTVAAEAAASAGAEAEAAIAVVADAAAAGVVVVVGAEDKRTVMRRNK